MFGCHSFPREFGYNLEKQDTRKKNNLTTPPPLPPQKAPPVGSLEGGNGLAPDDDLGSVAGASARPRPCGGAPAEGRARAGGARSSPARRTRGGVRAEAGSEARRRERRPPRNQRGDARTLARVLPRPALCPLLSAAYTVLGGARRSAGDTSASETRAQPQSSRGEPRRPSACLCGAGRGCAERTAVRRAYRQVAGQGLGG